MAYSQAPNGQDSTPRKNRLQLVCKICVNSSSSLSCLRNWTEGGHAYCVARQETENLVDQVSILPQGIGCRVADLNPLATFRNHPSARLRGPRGTHPGFCHRIHRINRRRSSSRT